MQHELHEIPPRLLKDLARAPIIEERRIDGVTDSGFRIKSDKPIREVPSKTQLIVLAYASHGLTDDMVARVMGISLNTVKRHVRIAIALLAAKNKLHAVAISLREGYIY